MPVDAGSSNRRRTRLRGGLLRTAALAAVLAVALASGGGGDPWPAAPRTLDVAPVSFTDPAPPASLSLAPADRQITASWPASTEANVRGYVVSVDGVARPEQTGLTLTLTGLTNGTTSTVAVRTVTYDGGLIGLGAQGPFTGTQAVTTSTYPRDAVAPAAPAATTATAGDGQVVVGWTANTADADVAGYLVYRDGAAVSGLVPKPATSWTDTGRTNGTTYTYTVRTQDTSRNLSVDSPSRTATPTDTTPPPAPTGVVVSAAPGTLTVSWNAVAAADLASYRVLLDGRVIGTVPAGTTTSTSSGLTGSATHTITVVAVDTAGNASAPSTPVTASHLDKTPPAAPTGVTAVAGDGSVAVSWNAAPETDLATYTVFRDGVAVATIPAGTTTTRVTGLANGTRYAFTVAAVDSSGNASAPSAAATATPVDTTPPPAPTGVTATGGDHSVTASWSAVPVPDLATYRVLLDGVAVTTVTGTTAMLTGLVEGRGYAVTVVAVDTAGNASAPSAPVPATPADTTPPAAPTGVTASPGPESLTVAWTAVTAPDVAYYRVLVDGAVAATPTGTSAVVSGLVGGRACTVTVVAVDAAGNASAPSAPVTATPVDTTPPAVPTGLTATPSDGAVTLSWTAVTAEDLAGYEVLQDGVRITTTTTTSYTATGLTNGTAYSFSIRAVDTAGNCSAASTPVSATPTAPAAPADSTPPATPTGVQATSGDGQVTVSWAPVADADLASYQVLQDGAVVATVSAGTSSYTVTGLAGGTSHSFTVRAVDSAGNTSAAATAVVATPAPTTPPTTPTGTPATGAGDGEGLAATRDGRYVVLGTRARLEAGDTNSAYELHLLDRVAGTARRVAPLPSTWVGTGTDSTNSSAVALSADGRYLALATTARLVTTDTNTLLDVYRLDLTTGVAQLVSVPPSGAVSSTTAGAVAPTAGGSAYATRAGVAISADGSRVLFSSARADLVSGDTNGTVDLFAKDASGGATGAVTRVSATATGANLSRTVQSPALALTPDGRCALFAATSSTGPSVLYRKDLVSGALVAASTVVSATGTTTEVGVFRDTGDVAVSDDGRYVAFSTAAQVGTSTPGASYGAGLAYRKDLTTGALVPLGTGQTGVWEHQASLDASGRYGFFETAAGEVPGDTNGHTDTYRRDLQTGALVLVTSDGSGAAAPSPSGPVDPKEYGPILVLTPDTVLVATLQPLVAGDTNGLKDVYRKDLATQAVSSAV